jgi:hypothetical protein
VCNRLCVWSNNIQIQLASSIQVGERERKRNKSLYSRFRLVHTSHLDRPANTRRISVLLLFDSIQFNSKKEKKRREKEISIIITCTNTHRERGGGKKERNGFPFSFFFRLLMEFDSSRTESKADVSHIESKKPTGKV